MGFRERIPRSLGRKFRDPLNKQQDHHGSTAPGLKSPGLPGQSAHQFHVDTANALAGRPRKFLAVVKGPPEPTKTFFVAQVWVIIKISIFLGIEMNNLGNTFCQKCVRKAENTYLPGRFHVSIFPPFDLPHLIRLDGRLEHIGKVNQHLRGAISPDFFQPFNNDKNQGF